MSEYRLTHLDDASLLSGLHDLAVRDRATTASLLAHIAEADARKLYLPAAYPSMFAYCVGELRFSEDAAYKRIQAARVALRFPRLFDEVASGRLHLTAVGLLAPHLSDENFDELVAAATHRGRTEIEAWLAQRFAAGTTATPASLKARLLPVRVPRTHESTPIQRDSTTPGLLDQLAPEQVDLQIRSDELPDQLAPEQVDSHVVQGAQPTPSQSLTPLFILRIPLDDATHAKLRRAQNLLAHAVPSGDLAAVLDRALDALIAALEKRKAAQTGRPAKPKRPARGRTIPAAIRREVWKRDKGRCTFTSDAGRRCESKRGLEFDHVIPFARGGEATLAGLRLRCRAHNQFEAERAFGEAFMRGKRASGRGHRAPPTC